MERAATRLLDIDLAWWPTFLRSWSDIDGESNTFSEARAERAEGDLPEDLTGPSLARIGDLR